MAPVRYQKPVVLDQIPLDGHAVIEASAGTGKTFTLEHLIVQILLSTETKVGELLVVTFTEKATGELRARVRKLLAKLVALEPEQGAGPEVPDERCWLIGDEQRARLAAALAAFDSATICTIHSFCRSVLSEYAFASQRLFDEELVDSREAFHRAFVEVLREELARGERRSLLQLWLERSGDVDALEETLYGCAGKASRIEPAFDEKKLDAALDAATIGSAAAARVKAEVAAQFPRVRIFDGAFDDVCGCLRQRLTSGSVVERLEALTELRDSKAFKDCTLRLLQLSEGSEGLAAGQRLVDLFAVAPTLESMVVTQFLPLVQERVARGKRERGQFDFQDMLSLLRDNLEGPHGAALTETLRARFRYALIDEFQDTDTVQWAVFRRVFFQSEGRCRLYLIGDPKQAIYAFRGADVHAYLAAREEVLAAGGARVPLRENYRSTKALIDGYNVVFEQDAEPSFFEGKIRYDEPVVAGNDKLAAVGPDGSPAVPVEVLEVVSPDGKQGKDLLLPLYAGRVAAEIRRLLSPGWPSLRFDAHDGHGPRPISARDIYVLTRGKEDGKIVGEALRAVGVPYAFYKQDGLFQTDEAEQVQDLLDALADLENPAKRLRAWMTPFFGLKLEELAGANELQDHPLLERLRGWKAVADERRWAKLFASLLDDSGLVRRQILLEQGERSLTNYGHIFELLLEELGGGHRSIADVANGLRSLRAGTRKPRSEEGNMQRLETDRDAVQILTMHASKGLEAAAVFLFGGLNSCNKSEFVFHDDQNERVLWLGKPPKDIQDKAAAEERQEDQRLLYVALTRAKARLYLPYFVTYKEGAREPLEFNGPYGVVHARLAAIEAAGDRPELFHWSDETPENEARSAGATAPQPLATVEPAPELLAPDDRAKELAALRTRHAGYVVTSYTRMGHGAPEEGEAKEEATGEDRQVAAPAEGELPGGANTGSYLHDLLAEIPAASAVLEADPEAFAKRPEVAQLFERFGRRYGIVEKDHVAHAEKLVHTGLTAKLQMGGRVLDGVCRAARLLREMEFLYPIPEESHPLLSRSGAFDGRPFEIRRGFVKGYVDLLFEHDGLAWFADWKSDSLARFTPEMLAGHVEREYRVQARLYTLAMVKLLGVRDEASYDARFGGLLYLFLRGMKPGGEGTEGVYFERPGWKQVVAWEEELLRRRDFGFGGEA